MIFASKLPVKINELEAHRKKTVQAWVLHTKQMLPAETGKQQLCTILGHKVLRSHEVSAGSVFFMSGFADYRVT